MKSILIISLLAVGTHEVLAQDPVFSQFYTNSLHLNPALAGMEKDIVLGMNYRSQWAAVNLPFKTFQFSAIHPIIQQGIKIKHLGGLGATIFSDEAGPNRELVSQGFSFTSSYNFHLNHRGNNLIAAGLQFGFVQRQVNMDALQWSSQYSSVVGYDPSLPGETLIAERVTTPVVNAGITWRLVFDNRIEPVKMFYQGFAVSNINRPKGFFLSEMDSRTIVFKAHGGYLHHLGNGFEISPNYLVQHQRSTQINVGAYGAYTVPALMPASVTDLKVSLGLWYRVEDSFIVTTGLSTPSWNAGFSYDANSSSLQRSFEGANAFEISFAYRISIIKTEKRFSTPLI
jgi:type IX secretion system PorP/SprF family membrane protein